MYDTCLTHLINLDIITLIIFYEVYKLMKLLITVISSFLPPPPS